METSDALDLEKGIFASDSPRRIALSLKRSAEHSTRRKAEPYRSAMSMLTFFINRAGRKLPARRRKTLTEAKEELRKLYGREPSGTRHRTSEKASKRSAPKRASHARKAPRRARGAAKLRARPRGQQA